MAFSPDSRSLAIAAGTDLGLWDMPDRRLRARLEPRDLAVRAIAFSPDGRSLAAAGKGRDHQGKICLYDLNDEPPTCRASLTIDRGEPPPAGPNPNAGREEEFVDVAFTPDGRRVVAMDTSSFVIWDAASGVQQEFIDHESGGFNGRFDVSPDGRWLAVGGSGNIALIDLGPAEP
jgi:WD40 repeat protein